VAFIGPILLGLLSVPRSSAQTKGTGSAVFEVASVRTSDPKAGDAGSKSKDGNIGGAGFGVEHKRFTARNANLLQLVVRAYGVKGCPPGPRVVDCPLLSGGPEWAKKDAFDIEAKMPEDSPEYSAIQFLTGQAPQLQLMLQALLAERFKLKVRREKKQLPVYVLTVGSKGPKLTRANEGEPPVGPLFRPIAQPNGETMFEMTVKNKSMQEVVDTFSQLFNRPVLDRTGLKGKFDLTIEYEGNVDQPGPFSELTGPGLFTAFKEQAGLKLDGTKAAVEVLTIDHVDRPSQN